MDDFLRATLLGIVEGLTEFLPVSSTAHLRVTQSLMGISLQDEFWAMFAVVIQLGAILALPVYFGRKLAEFVRTYPRGAKGDRTWLTHPLGLVAVAFVVTAVPAFLLNKLIADNLKNLYVMGGALIVGGIIMWVVDAMCRRPHINHVDEMLLPQAVWIGAAQILSAVFRGRRGR